MTGRISAVLAAAGTAATAATASRHLTATEIELATLAATTGSAVTVAYFQNRRRNTLAASQSTLTDYAGKRLTELEGQVDALRAQIDSLMADTDAERRHYRQQIADLEDRNSRLENEVTVLTRRLDVSGS